MKTSKENLRDTMWKAHKTLPSTVRKQSDSALFFQMRHLEPLQNAGVVFLFVGNPPEPETFEWIEYLLNLGKIVAVPLCLEHGRMEARCITATTQLVPGKFGILEPVTTCPMVEKEKVDVTLVPAVCFGRDGSRLGRGGGYYDRWLQGYRGVAIGVCRAQFLLERVPVEPHDETVDYIVTEDEVIAIS